MRYWSEAQKVCFVTTLALSGAGLFVVLLQVGIPGEDDPAAWWFLAPFAVPALVAAGLALRNGRLAWAVLMGGLLGGGGVLLAMFGLAAMTMTS